KRRIEARPDFEKWLASAEAKPFEPAPSDEAELTLLLAGTSGPFHGTAQGEKIEWTAGTERMPGPFGSAPLIGHGGVLEAGHPSFGRRGNASFGAFIYVEEKPDGALFSRMDKAEGYRGWDLFLTAGKPTVHVIDRWPDASLKITAKEALMPGRWHHLMATF